MFIFCIKHKYMILLARLNIKREDDSPIRALPLVTLIKSRYGIVAGVLALSKLPCARSFYGDGVIHAAR